MSAPAERSRPLPAMFDAEAALRRSVDVTCAVVALLGLAPVMLLVAAAIYLEGGCPIFYSQIRLGRGGRLFRMHKFRKFRVDARTEDSPLTMASDARLTRVGHFLASTKLDELPQFWNLLIGEMSMVGPRPESLAFADCFTNGFERVLDHTPGLLGPCQVLFRNEAQLYPKNGDAAAYYRDVLFPTKARIDLEYFSRRSFMGDLRWLLLSVMAVFGSGPPAVLSGLPTGPGRIAREAESDRG
jgi:lipopolysaccharide/colanic/teichoic acid biosynthesis glycosyltransferase